MKVLNSYGISNFKNINNEAHIFDTLRLKNDSINRVRFARPKEQLLGVSASSLIVPKQIPREDKTKVEKLFQQIQKLCPNCSTGATIGGKPIVGLNVPSKTGSTLFDVGYLGSGSSDYGRITKSEYDLLKLKA
ncbi:MAG: hypothetical protein GY784_18690, partial [Gammaproteobacteria bacterium]|nr:hypothetical protein [Gammaproteobacteria bacterium]